ncbi:MAG: nickel-dependent hydrogenase large subunit [Acidobacteriota bacterium]
MAGRTIKVDYLARVEGEGGLVMRFAGKTCTGVELRIFEPPRFFEALLRGRACGDAPDVTARICGICPVAYQMSACHAVEDALGVKVEGSLRALRRLLYCGEWIESHALHVFMLHAPDFLGFEDAIAMAKVHPELVKSGLRMKKAGNAIVALLGGREIHPVNVRIGGFYRVPEPARFAALLPELAWGYEAALASLRWASGLPFPAFERDYELVALRHPDEYPFCEGRIVSSKGLDVDVHDYERVFREEHVERSTALHSTIAGRGSYLCGPLARVGLNVDRLAPEVGAAAREAGLPTQNPFKSILARLVELAHAFGEARRIIEGLEHGGAASVDAPPRAGTGMGCTEAPRGILYHRYVLDERGDIVEAKIVPPTSQNQGCIEDDLRALAPLIVERPHDAATRLAEQAVRNYDPCISCATHFLDLRIEREE